MNTTAAIKERGLPLQPTMVRATLRDLEPKSQTRRLMSQMVPPRTTQWLNGLEQDLLTWWPTDGADYTGSGIVCPYGKPGDRLWVREPWCASSAHDDLTPREIPVGDSIAYLADGTPRVLTGRSRHPRFMCRWMSRILLEITEIRVQRLQEISEADAKAEGITSQLMPVDGGERLLWGVNGPWWAEDPISGYLHLWEDIHNPKGYCPDDNAACWGANPWVWAVSFRRLP